MVCVCVAGGRGLEGKAQKGLSGVLCSGRTQCSYTMSAHSPAMKRKAVSMTVKGALKTLRSRRACVA